jgi:succinoglycan biosynthesis protein ExoM
MDPGLSYEIVIVDNDSQRSSQSVVAAFYPDAGVPIRYDCEPERNISLARNRAVRNASGTLIAFIDDDELPRPDWLSQLHRTMNACGADGVLGPVLPDFPSDAPAWLKRASEFRRRRLRTGARIGEGDGRTGNVLLRKSIITDAGCWFDPAFGRTGGEDTDFFYRQFERGGVFVWCDEAAVTETVPPERWKMTFHLKRLLRAGTIDGELMRSGKLASDGLVFRNVVLGCACAAAAVPSIVLLPRHRWVKVAQKLAYCTGVVSAYCGHSFLRYRD